MSRANRPRLITIQDNLDCIVSNGYAGSKKADCLENIIKLAIAEYETELFLMGTSAENIKNQVNELKGV